MSKIGLNLYDIMVLIGQIDLGWYLIGLAFGMWCYGLGRQIHTQEGYW